MVKIHSTLHGQEMTQAFRKSHAIGQSRLKRTASAAWFFFIAPWALYAFLFIVFTYPLIRHFSSEVWGYGVDGYADLWGLWWVDHAVVELRQWPWFCPLTFYPKGVNLMGHSLGAFNGFAAIILLRGMTLIEAHNFLVLSSFATAGLMAFALAYEVTRHYGAALVAGFIFGFCPYHFAHAHGHLNLTSLQWLPGFVWAWWVLMRRPAVGWAALAALFLLLNLLCDPLYFIDAVLAGALLYATVAFERRNAAFIAQAPFRVPIAVFLLLAVGGCAPIVGSFLWAHGRDPFLGGHPPGRYGLDLLALIIPGGTWRFYTLTEAFWSRLASGYVEGSGFLGWSVVALIVCAWYARRAGGKIALLPWVVLIVFFGTLALGPWLQVWGRVLPRVPLPYQIGVTVLPVLKLSGVPARMVVMVALAASVLAAVGFKFLAEGTRRSRVPAVALVALLVLEYLPAPIPLTVCPIPDYVFFLRDLPGEGAVADTYADPQASMVYQTVHGRAIGWGFSSKHQRSLRQFNAEYHRQVIDCLETGDFAPLRELYGFQYVVLLADEEMTRIKSPPRLIYEDEWVKIYDLKDA